MYIPPNLIEPLLIRKPASVITYPVAIWNDRSKLPVGYAAIAGMCCVRTLPCLFTIQLREANYFIHSGGSYHHGRNVASVVGGMDRAEDPRWRWRRWLRTGLCRHGTRLSAMSSAREEAYWPVT